MADGVSDGFCDASLDTVREVRLPGCPGDRGGQLCFAPAAWTLGSEAAAGSRSGLLCELSSAGSADLCFGCESTDGSAAIR